jgi:hypothetical protein
MFIFRSVRFLNTKDSPDRCAGLLSNLSYGLSGFLTCHNCRIPSRLSGIPGILGEYLSPPPGAPQQCRYGLCITRINELIPACYFVRTFVITLFALQPMSRVRRQRIEQCI